MLRLVCAVLLILLAPLARPAVAQPADEETFVINLRDADIRALAEQVSAITGRTLILDPGVSGEVTVISAEPLDPTGVWDLFQSVLRTQGFVALRSGNIWRVLPQEAARTAAGDLPEAAAGRLDVITRLIQLRNVPAEAAVGALRPLVASFGYIEALPDTNTILLTDNVENVERIEAIAQTLDRGGGSQVSTVPVRNADAAEVAAALGAVLGPQAGGLAPEIAVDARSNLLVVRGDPETIDNVRRLTAELDQPGRAVPTLVPVTRVYRLNFADAAVLVEVLRGVIGSGGVATSPIARALEAPPAPPPLVQEASIAGQFGAAAPAPAGEGEAPALAFPPPVASLAAEEITVQPATDINAVVVRARAEVQADLAQLIAQLDQRRPQVLIEAAIVEISGEISEALGVQLGLGGAAPEVGFAATSFSPVGLTLDNILSLLGVPASAAIAPTGASVGLSREDQFGILIQALSQSTRANLLSTPSLTTLDNQPAEIVVGQNVPFRTGTFSPSGSASDPFTTIQRQDVGITLRVLPRVNQGDVVQLDVAQEVSSIAPAVVPGAADIITNRRVIQTTVLADNGSTVVLGGLITDDRQSQRSQVPGLGDVPVVGRIFRSDAQNATRRTLFVFLRPTILRTRTDLSAVSAQRFQRLRSIQAAPAAAPASAPAPGPTVEPRPIRRLPVEIGGLY